MGRDGWFATRVLEPGVHLISEPVHVNSFLVVGENGAALIDSGLGIGDIRDVVESLTDLPVLVVNTHYHFDHTGGNHLFSEVAIHKRGVEPVGQPVPEEVLERYTAYTEAMLEAFELYRQLDDRFFHFFADETTPRSLPPGFDPRTWRIVPTVPSRVLSDGDVLDLGGRKLRVIHSPGHTPDCICLLDEANGILFGGDTINTGPIYAHLPDSDLEAFARSTRQLTDLVSGIRVVYMPHFVRYAMDPAFLVEVADGFQAILAGEVELRSNLDCLDFPVKETCFARFSVFLPDTEAGESTPRLSAGLTPL